MEVIHHIDGDPTNNDPANLMRVTAKGRAKLAAAMPEPKFGEVWQWDGAIPRMVIGPTGDEEGVYLVICLDDDPHIAHNYFPPHEYAAQGKWERLQEADE